MLVAIPTEAPGGLDATISEHFGHSETYTLVQVEGESTGEITVIPNEGHAKGGCMAPVSFLREQGVEALVAGGMGGRPLAGFQEAGVSVFSHEKMGTVAKAIEAFIAGELREFGPADACSSGCSGDESDPHHHGHAPIERVPIEGPADVRDDRVVTLDYVLRDPATGETLEVSEGRGPMRFLYGRGQIVAGLERALAGLSTGDRIRVAVPPEDGFGPRDPKRVIEVPRQNLPDDVEPGMVMAMRSPKGPTPVVVLSLDDDTARLDANHPYAGKELDFEVTVVDVQAAVVEELEAGRVLG
ncbi:MAG: hypothetical protein CME06_09550 [Gemmatimonadetes bacterium]|nr:hypothetical protein [Gemmatimonadota bacterium]